MRRMDLYSPERVTRAVTDLDAEITELEARLRTLRRARAILARSLPRAVEVPAPDDGGRWEDDGGRLPARHAV